MLAPINDNDIVMAHVVIKKVNKPHELTEGDLTKLNALMGPGLHTIISKANRAGLTTRFGKRRRWSG